MSSRPLGGATPDAMRSHAPTLLVDLDGTLIDTAPDMGAALNALRAAYALPALPLATLRASVSHGAAGLVRLGFPETSASEQDGLRYRFVHLYRERLTEHGTTLFADFAPILAQLAERERPWGIVTNKPGWLTDPLLKTLALPHPPAVVISGDTTAERKPHPLPLTTACAQLGVAPETCLYVGDAERDIQAARSAGMPSALAGWGYFGADEAVESWGADWHLASPLDLAAPLGLSA